jgi:hypothetical protein
MTNNDPTSTVEQIRIVLADTVRDLAAGRISPAQANATSRSAGRALASMKAQLRGLQAPTQARLAEHDD